MAKSKLTELEFYSFTRKDIPLQLQREYPELYTDLVQGAIVNCAPKHGGIFTNDRNLLALFYIVHPDLANHFNDPLILGE